MRVSRLTATLLVMLLVCGRTWADGNLKLQKVVPDVYAIVGELGNRTEENLGNNATFGFVVTTDGVVLIDSGGTYKGAGNIDALIRTVTDKPVVTVINTGGQDHRWLGNGYFRQRGAQIIASEKALLDQKKRARDQLIALGSLVREESIAGTAAVYADKTFATQFEFGMGGTQFEIHHSGQAHTPGDSYVWLPGKRVMFTGDIVFVERMLGVGPESNSKSWMRVFETVAAYKPRYLIPGHGHATDLSRAQKETYGYLRFLRKSVADFMGNGGDISAIGSLDQSQYSYLQNYDSIAGRNAQQVFAEMEWE